MALSPLDIEGLVQESPELAEAYNDLVAKMPAAMQGKENDVGAELAATVDGFAQGVVDARISLKVEEDGLSVGEAIQEAHAELAS